MKIPRYLCRRSPPAAQPLSPVRPVAAVVQDNRVTTTRLAPHTQTGRQQTGAVFQSGSLCVDLSTRTVKVGDKDVRLSGTEYSLLHLLVRHAGNVLTNEEILREIWGTETLEKLDYLRVYLRALRKKLENPSEPSLFLIEPAVGCRLVIREP